MQCAQRCYESSLLLLHAWSYVARTVARACMFGCRGQLATVAHQLCGLLHSLALRSYLALGAAVPGDILSGFRGPKWAVVLANIAVLIHMLGAFQVLPRTLYYVKCIAYCTMLKPTVTPHRTACLSSIVHASQLCRLGHTMN